MVITLMLHGFFRDHENIMLLLRLSHFSHVRLLETSWTVAYQPPPSMGFSRQEYWSGVPLPSPFLSSHSHFCHIHVLYALLFTYMFPVNRFTCFLNLFIFIFGRTRPLLLHEGSLQLRCTGISLRLLLLLQNTALACAGSVVVVHRLSCLVAGGIFPD